MLWVYPRIRVSISPSRDKLELLLYVVQAKMYLRGQLVNWGQFGVQLQQLKSETDKTREHREKT